MLDERLIGSNMIECVAIDGTKYHYLYDSENLTLYCIENNQILFKIDLKPNLEYFNENNKHKYFSNGKDKSLISQINIDPDIYDKLVNEGIIRYSSLSADLYDLPKEKAFDAKYHKRDYKNKKNKSLVLQRYHNGIFN